VNYEVLHFLFFLGCASEPSFPLTTPQPSSISPSPDREVVGGGFGGVLVPSRIPLFQRGTTVRSP
jgi:hypothetical protein